MIPSQNKKLIQQLLFLPIGWVLIAFFLANGLEYPSKFLGRIFIPTSGMVIIICINIYFLLPNFYFKGKITQFILCSFILVFLLMVITYNKYMPWADWIRTNRLPILERNFQEFSNLKIGMKFMVIMRLMVPGLIGVLGSTLIEVSRYANEKEKEIIAIEKVRLDSELKFLKSQINPHFLFNVLNNIYTLSVIKSDKTPGNLLRLSEILRYMLYETNNGKVPLKKELAYIKNFVELMGLKDSRGLNVNLNLDESQPNIKVAPLLFIPFLENAYKHSKIEDLQKGFINVSLITTANQLEFKVTNSTPAQKFTKDKVGGIGLQNIRQRLELLYPQNHQLDIVEGENGFSVTLKLNIPCPK